MTEVRELREHESNADHVVPVRPGAGVIGTARRRRDGEAKVLGQTRYVGDMAVHGLLHARPVLAAEAHARLLEIDGSAALALPGVVAVLTAADLGLKGGSGRVAEPLAREEIVWSGQPVALVIAETAAAAEDGAALVLVEADPLPAVLDLEAAMADDADRARVTAVAGGGDGGAGAHGAGGGEEESGELPPNVAVRQRLQNGDVDAGLARADAVVSGRFRTNWIHQAYIEPQSALAWTEPDGALVVHSSTQGAFMVREGLADMLGLPLDRVRVQAAPLGGAFGGKLMISEPLAAAAALKLKRPGAAGVRSQRGLRGRQPGAGPADRPRARRHARRQADRDPRPDRRRPRRAGGDGRRDDLDDALRRAVPLARARPDRGRRDDQPRERGRLPRARRTAGRVRGRVADRPARGRVASSTRSSCGCATCSSRATRASTARRSSPSARASASNASRRIRCGSGAARCRRARASASRSASGRAAWSPRPRSASSTPTAS